jgi:hypothetical protein
MTLKQTSPKFYMAIAAVPAAMAAAVLGLYTTSLSDPYCLIRESSWLKAKTKHELESRLFAFYSSRKIDPAMTVWNRAPLKNGQTVIRYLIFDKERLDALIASDGTIVDMFTAYQ